MDEKTLNAALKACTTYLAELEDQAWTADVPLMNLTVGATVAHTAQCMLWYSVDLSAGTPELPTMEASVKADAKPADLIRTLNTAGRLLAAAVAAADEDTRGWHPAGNADPSGFAAMGCDELLVHTADIATALNHTFEPSREVAEATLRRLFPWAPQDTAPWPTLLWANDRKDLPTHKRPGTGWVWHCAPLKEWNGKVPTWKS